MEILGVKRLKSIVSVRQLSCLSSPPNQESEKVIVARKRKLIHFECKFFSVSFNRQSMQTLRFQAKL